MTATVSQLAVATSGATARALWVHAAEDLNADLPYTILGGGVKRLGADLRLTTAPGMPAVAALAVGGRTVALVPRGQVGSTTTPRPTLRTIEVRDGATLGLRGTLTTQGTIDTVATSASIVAARVIFAAGTAVSGALTLR